MADRFRGLAGRDSVRIGTVVALLALIAIVTAWLKFGRSFPFENDARIFLRIAQDPFGNGSSLQGLRSDTGTGYRYGRILYPLAAWILAAGRPALVAYTLPVVYALAVGAMVALACEMTGSPRRGLWVLAAPSFLLTVPVLFSEPLTVALLLLMYLLFSRGSEGGARAAAALLLLTREAMLLAVFPLIVSSWRADRRSAVRWAWPALPVVAWWSWVRFRVGVWPPFDPAYGRRGALTWPLGGPIGVASEGIRDRGVYILAAVLLVATVAGCVYAWRRRTSIVARGALLLAALSFCLGPGAWRIPGEAMRLLLPAQALAIVAVATKRRVPDS